MIKVGFSSISISKSKKKPENRYIMSTFILIATDDDLRWNLVCIVQKIRDQIKYQSQNRFYLLRLTEHSVKILGSTEDLRYDLGNGIQARK